jgi:2-hydroxy-6-oxonona-2,4-dienedioate hydrolase
MTLGSGPLVVLMHGFAGSAEVFMDPFRSNLSSALVARGYSILMYDFFGHGHSDSPDIAYAAELFASQLADICLFLNIKGPFHILAHSMGASVAARFLAVHPQMVDRVILLSPSVADYPLEVRLRFALRVPILGEILGAPARHDASAV